MLRVTEYIKNSLEGKIKDPFRGVILIWNLTNRCNLYCKHCYAWANRDKDELSTKEALSLIDQLVESNVKHAILSGGEPLLREDVYEIAKALRSAGIKTSLSTNGLLINEENVKLIKESFDYVGISVDGTREVHDRFRGMRGAFERSLGALTLCTKEGINVGVRFTLTKMTQNELPYVFELAQKLRIRKVYISHLVHAGRGERLSAVEKENYRRIVKFILEKAFEWVEKGKDISVVTGNNEADAVLLYEMFSERYPSKAHVLYENLRRWGGNQAGVRLVNIDHRGNVKPDPFFRHTLGNVREKPFTQIWNSNGLLSRLRQYPRRIKGKCEGCEHIYICNGNSRARAYSAFGDYFAEDPLCYI
ncbi:MAG: radical SAM protein [Aquificae bacterium]|nr:radical SAM protein [Aquificota bacterium]